MMSKTNTEKTTPERKSPWEKSRIPNLVRYAPSGIYFARLRVSGKLIWKSLKTDVYSVAEQRLPDEIKTHRQTAERERKTLTGKMTFADALKIYEDRLGANAKLKNGEGLSAQVHCSNGQDMARVKGQRHSHGFQR
jgi:hypothetical protein